MAITVSVTVAAPDPRVSVARKKDESEKEEQMEIVHNDIRWVRVPRSKLFC